MFGFTIKSFVVVMHAVSDAVRLYLDKEISKYQCTFAVSVVQL